MHRDAVSSGRGDRVEVLLRRFRHQVAVDDTAQLVDPFGDRLQDDRPDRHGRDEVPVADVEVKDPCASAQKEVDLFAEVCEVRRIERRLHLYGSNPFTPGHGPGTRV